MTPLARSTTTTAPLAPEGKRAMCVAKIAPGSSTAVQPLQRGDSQNEPDGKGHPAQQRPFRRFLWQTQRPKMG
jgi:hypothetical protein